MPEKTQSDSQAAVMLGMQMPNSAKWSDRVFTALGQNPSAFTGPGTNTYLVGTGSSKILLDTGDGRSEFLPVLEEAMEASGCGSIQEIVLTHGHGDHIGGVRPIFERFGPCKVSKMKYEPFDGPYDLEINELSDGDIVETEGATLRAIHTPGHAPDHLCFMLEEEAGLFTGDNVLGIGTTIIPAETGSLIEYMHSLERLLAEQPACIFPAHGPRVENGQGKIQEYIDHRLQREQQILEAMEAGAESVMAMVEIIYAAYPKALHAAAAQSVTSHLIKLQEEGKAALEPGQKDCWRIPSA